MNGPTFTQQQGSTLFVALIMLLVITLLALSGAREVALESRITGNFIEQQKLVNDAEATLREGERQLTKGYKPPEPACTTASAHCLLSSAPAYTPDFTTKKSYTIVASDTSSHDWNAIPTPSGATESQSENPEYGNMMMGIGTFRYEINARSTQNQTQNTAKLRSNVAKVYN